MAVNKHACQVCVSRARMRRDIEYARAALHVDDTEDVLGVILNVLEELLDDVSRETLEGR